ncbi:MAG: YhgE/Pip family protein [Thermoleophilia bacterium]
MRSFRVALLEIKRLFSAPPIRLAIAAICLVPLLYCVLYLWAFWNPYARVSSLPVAIVNLDQPARINDTTLHAGSDLVAALKKSKSFGWTVVSAAHARAGLKNQKYYISLTIPANFSANLASANTAAPRAATLIVQQNEASNLLATQIASRVFVETQLTMAQTIQHRYFSTVFVAFSDLHGQIVKAHDGALQLSRASTQAGAGAEQLIAGLNSMNTQVRGQEPQSVQLAIGAAQVKSSSQQVAVGATMLAGSLGRAQSGGSALAAGSTQLATGTQTLAASLRTLAKLGVQLRQAARTLAGGAGSISAGTQQMSTQLDQAAQAAGSLSTATTQVAQALQASAAATPAAGADPTFAAALSGVEHVDAGLGQLNTALQAAAPQVRLLAGGAAKVDAGAATLAGGLGQYSTAVNQAAAGAATLAGGAGSFAGGATRLSSGLAQAHADAATLATGSRRVAGGATQLLAGVAQVKTNTFNLGAGINLLVNGGLDVRAGLTKIGAGAQTLATKLGTGAKSIPAYSAQQQRTQATMMSSPVALTTERLHPVPNYGTGFAPYFIPLALWVGALMAYFIIRPLGGRALASTLPDYQVALSSLWPALAVSSLQAVVMLLVLQFALGLHPVNVLAFYGFTLVSALCFTTILQWLSATFGPVGKFVAVVLLMLQLTSSAGTFPLQLVPKFFRVINPVLPMTYVVQGLRQAISGNDLRLLAFDIAILLAFTAAAGAVTLVTTHRRRQWTMDRLKPVFTLG